MGNFLKDFKRCASEKSHLTNSPSADWSERCINSVRRKIARLRAISCRSPGLQKQNNPSKLDMNETFYCLLSASPTNRWLLMFCIIFHKRIFDWRRFCHSHSIEIWLQEKNQRFSLSKLNSLFIVAPNAFGSDLKGTSSALINNEKKAFDRVVFLRSSEIKHSCKCHKLTLAQQKENLNGIP